MSKGLKFGFMPPPFLASILSPSFMILNNGGAPLTNIYH